VLKQSSESSELLGFCRAAGAAARLVTRFEYAPRSALTYADERPP
jgi:hypothetical protein